MSEGKLLLSFPDCPYGCVDGRIFNTGLKSLEDCPYCKEKRESLVKDNNDSSKSNYDIDLYKELNIPEYYRGIDYSLDTAIPNTSRLTEESVKNIDTYLVEIYNRLNLKQVLSYSVMINLGASGNIFAFIYPYMLKAYRKGLTVAPLISNIDIANNIIKLERGFDNSYLDWLECDVSIVTIQGGITHNGIAVIRGYMQERAKRGRGTIIFTNAKVDMYMKGLLCSENNESCLHLARFISVEYISHKNDENYSENDISTYKDNNTSGKSVITMEELMKQNF